ncbi:MAG: endolytic transglycosylase MltG [bacterium]
MRTLLWIAALGVLLAAVAAAGITYFISPVDARARPTIVIVPSGATTPEVGRRLEASGVVRSASHFAYAARLRRVTRSLHQGEYQVSPAMPLLAIVDKIAKGDVVLHPVTIPEGYTAQQIVEALAGKGLGNIAALREIVQSGADRYPYEFLRNAPGGSLEGYLFPDTYHLPRFVGEKEVIGALLQRFGEAVVPSWRLLGGGRSLHEIITVASMVEREAQVPAERSLIAGVIYNRLKRGWRLEVDATVLYALGRHKSIVTYEDLKVNSPYNTYLRAGLPPGPIASPGIGAITAALSPEKTEYLFYVARPDGSHIFNTTLSAHLAAIRRLRGP